MKCPKCSSENISVVDSRGDDSTIRRRRECQACQFRFTTYERLELTLPMVVKKDGRREPFDRAKIRGGLVKACEKRPISADIIERTIDQIELRVSNYVEKEISSRQIGDILMDALKGVDKVAYVRFASVYREFSDVSEFVDTLRGLGELAATRRAKKADGEAG